MSTPKIAKLDKERLIEKIRTLGSVYLPAWRPKEGEPGWAVARLYADMYEGLSKEADAVPLKLFISYLDALGFSRAPARAASAPVVFTLAKSFRGSVTVPRGTALESVKKVRYETDRDFTAFSAKVSAFLALDPDRNEVADLTDAVVSQKRVTLFERGGGARAQYIYFGDDDLFRIRRFAGDPDAYLEYIVPLKGVAAWEFWGKGEADESPSWLPFTFSGDDLNKKGNSATVKREIDGIKTYWIRAEVTKETSADRDYRVTFKSRSGIDALYHNDVAIDHSRKIYPFGRLPQRNDSFYIASGEAFSKRGTRAAIDFGGSDMKVESDGTVKFGDGIVTFEYFNGASWKPLPVEKYGTEGDWAEEVCDLSFKVPYDLSETSVNGDKNLWIRCRLVGGAYTCTEGSAGISFEIPVFDTVNIYVKSFAWHPKHLLREAHGTFEDLLATGGWSDPYKVVADEKSIYIGFDSPLQESETVSMLLLPEEGAVEEGSLLEWFYLSDEGWVALPVEDGTNGFTQSGFLRYISPEGQTKRTLYGKECCWIKAVFPKDTPEIPFDGLFLNAVEVTECTTVDKELLGSSDGSASQCFRLSHTPAFDLEVWVLEPEYVEGEQNQKERFGEGYWVLWSRTEDLSAQNSEARCYTFDPYSGKICFGDGIRGMIPPAVQNGISATYRYGGGLRGNAAAGEIKKAIDTISYLDKLFNPLPAEGGADAQTLESLLKRAPLRIKHRYRAVRSEDYKALVMESSSDVARVEVAALEGKIELYLLPFGEGERPTTDRKLKKRVEASILSRAPAVAEVEVKGAVYVPVGVELEVLVDDWSLAARVKGEILSALERFLHPIEGGRESGGWEFSEAPTLSDIIALVGVVEGVSGILSLNVSVDVPGDDIWEFSLTNNETIRLERGWMVCSGEHSIRIRGA